MRAVSPSRRHRSKAAASFSLKPVAVLLCAVLIVRLVSTTDILARLSGAVSGWTSSKEFAELSMRGAGMPGSSEGGIDWTLLLSAQSAALGILAPAVDGEAGSPAHDPAAVSPASVIPSAPPAVLLELPKTAPVFSRGFWYFPTGVAPSALESATPEELPDTTSSEPVDGRVLPTPSPGDPNAKRVLEVTLTAPEGSPGVYINNKTKYPVSAQDMLLKKPALKVSDAAKPQVLIVHTHGSESFLPDERDFYVPTDIERTEDTRYNVVRLGDEMEKGLSTLGLNVIHDREIYDSPSYNGAYGRSLAAIQKHMKDYPSIQVVIDIHRDSISASDGSMYKAVSPTEKGKAAQMMIVVGSDGSGLTHPNWKQNLSFACDIDRTVLDKYPTLMRPVNLRKERFNQHATTGSIILEVGTAGNTLSEAILSIELFCETAGARIAELLRG